MRRPASLLLILLLLLLAQRAEAQTNDEAYGEKIRAYTTDAR